MEGRLKEWYLILGEYRQIQIQNSTMVEELLQFLYAEFVVRPDHYQETAREEFLAMKCCSFLRKDLERHYDRMPKRFYCINVIDDVNLKQAFLNSFQEPLGAEAQKIMIP